MKQTLRIIIMLAVAIVVALPAAAQGGKDAPRTSREENARVQAHHIAKELAFDDATTQKFVDAYCNCQQELMAVGREVKAKSDSEAEIKREIESRFDRCQKLLDIRKKYYKEYSSFLTQRQIDRVYKLEKKMMNRLQKHKAAPRNKKPRAPRRDMR